MLSYKDLNDKTIVVTGSTSGIGFAAARALASQGAYVIGVSRSTARCQDAKDTILARCPGARIDFCAADLSSQRQVRDLAASIAECVEAVGGRQIDVLVNNAGTVSSWYAATEDGYELQFAVNHLAPFLLTHELMPLLRRAPAARVITVSSGSHYGTKMHWTDVMYRRRYSCLAAYKQSKLANVLFTAELNRRLGEGAHVRAYAVDPGLVNTEIGLKGTGGIERWVWQWRQGGGVSPAQGAATVIFLASEPLLEHPDEIYWKDCRPVQPSRYVRRPEEAARLWSLSERLCGMKGIGGNAANELRGSLGAARAY
ncbi:MAG: SDR family oxidoreductase [Anaerolineae bacterium]|nr:SDR family oxidoreductase [Anaerolineae bacterium]